jgi:hypothetical protein
LFSVRPQRDRFGSRNPGLGRGAEIAMTPLVFVGLGWLADQAAGTSPLFILVLGAVGIIGTFVKAWIGYDAGARKEEAGKPWTRSAAPAEARAPEGDT